MARGVRREVRDEETDGGRLVSRSYGTAPGSRGIVEHLERATFFDTEARSATNPTAAFRHWIAAVYFLRAAVELMRETAGRGELTVGLPEWDRLIVRMVPRWRLVHQLRVRDFHHGSVIGPSHMRLEYTLRIPALGHADVQLRVNPARPHLRFGVSDGSRPSKFFLTSGFLVQDHLEPRPILLPRPVDEQLRHLPRALQALLQVLRS
jgi:hypothetical protein